MLVLRPNEIKKGHYLQTLVIDTWPVSKYQDGN
jgi:hypothetical protein